MEALRPLSLIVAMDPRRVIGDRGGLPWHLSSDLRRFKRLTMGHHLLMGRKTWESIGRPLPGRRNIVITRQAGYVAAGADVVDSSDAAVAAAGDAAEIMIIGGSEIYVMFLPAAERIYLTRVHADVDGDAFFPAPGDDWRLVSEATHGADARNDHDVSFRVYER